MEQQTRQQIVISRNSNEQEVFTRNYAKFYQLLPSIIEELLVHLVASNVISFDDEEEIMSQATSSSKTRAVLMPIRKALFEGISRPFHELLRIMRSSQQVECMELAKQICSEVNIDEDNTEIASQVTSGKMIIMNHNSGS